MSVLIAISRVDDYQHRWWDILVHLLLVRTPFVNPKMHLVAPDGRRVFETLSVLLEKSYFARDSTNCFVFALLYPRGMWLMTIILK